MATIAENLQTIKDSTDDIRQAILDKGELLTGGIVTYADAISNLLPRESDVIFYDYDGTLLYSYTKDKFLTLTSLPELPSQPGLICQGWNWTLEDAKTHVQEYGKLNIGAIYITDDNKTRLYINLLNNETEVSLYISQSVANGVSVTWGDNSGSVTLSGVNDVIFNHTYNKAGYYTITLTVNSGTCRLGHNNLSYNVMGPTNKNASDCLYKVEIGSNMGTLHYAFQYCYSLRSITIPNSIGNMRWYVFRSCYSLTSINIPNSVTSIENYNFSNCYSLTYITIPNSITSIGQSTFSSCYSLRLNTIPDSVTSIGESAFQMCYSLTSIIIPNSVTSIGKYAFYCCYTLTSVIISDSMDNTGSYAFNTCYSLRSVFIPNSVTSIENYNFSNCYSLRSVTIPNSVTSIGESAFRNCKHMKYYDFTSHASIPTLSNTNAFDGISVGCEIRVPATLYNDWINATNWSSYADYIVTG